MRALALAALASLLLPAAAAAPPLVLNDSVPASGVFRVPSTGEADWTEHLWVLTGSVRVTGTVESPFVFLDAGEARVTLVERLEVFVSTTRTLRDLTPEVFTDATVVPEPGASFLWAPVVSRVDARMEYATGVFLEALGENRHLERLLGEAPQAPGFGSSNLGATVTTEALEEGESFLVPLTNGTRVRVEGTRNAVNLSRVFTGEQYVFRVLGAPLAVASAEASLVPLEPGTEYRFGAADGDTFEAGFDLEDLEDLVDRVAALRTGTSLRGDTPDEQGNETADSGFLDSPAARALAGLEPVLNGVILGKPEGELRVGSGAFGEAGVTLVRFESLEVRGDPLGEDAEWSAASKVVFADNELKARSRGLLAVGPVLVPWLGLLFWAAALGALYAAREKKPPRDEERNRKMRLPSLAAWAFLWLAGFVLWDREVSYLFGTSLLKEMGLAFWLSVLPLPAPPVAAGAAALGFAALVELVPFTVAHLAFGLPTNLGTNAGLRFAGLGTETRGFGRGLGVLVTWLLGARLILPIAASFVENLIKRFA